MPYIGIQVGVVALISKAHLERIEACCEATGECSLCTDRSSSKPRKKKLCIANTVHLKHDFPRKPARKFDQTWHQPTYAPRKRRALTKRVDNSLFFLSASALNTEGVRWELNSFRLPSHNTMTCKHSRCDGDDVTIKF